MGEPGTTPGGGYFAREFQEHLLKQFRVEVSSRLRKTAQTHRSCANIILQVYEVTRHLISRQLTHLCPSSAFPPCEF